MAITPGSQFSNEIETTAILDAGVIYDLDVNRPEFKEILVQLGIFINKMVHAINKKETGYYPLQEYGCSKRIFPNPAYSSSSSNSQQDRPVFRTTIDFGTLPNAGTKSVPHNISVTPGLVWVHIEGVATDPSGLTGLPIPYADPTALTNAIAINVDATNVNIITGIDRTNYTICLVYLEYTQT